MNGLLKTPGHGLEAAKDRYGPLVFAVALIHVFVVDFATWLICMPMWPFVIFALPICLAHAAAGTVVALASGIVGQIGRGMLLGSLAAPLSMIIFGAVWAIASAVGPL